MEYVNALKAAEENGLYLKIVTSVKNFDSYNSFYNIYGESEEPCRRIAVPSNYIINKTISVIFALCSVSALGLRSLKNNDNRFCRILLIISIVGNMIQLLFF